MIAATRDVEARFGGYAKSQVFPQLHYPHALQTHSRTRDARVMKFIRFELWAASQFDQVLPFRIWGYAICHRLKPLSGIQASSANERGAGPRFRDR